MPLILNTFSWDVYGTVLNSYKIKTKALWSVGLENDVEAWCYHYKLGLSPKKRINA